MKKKFTTIVLALLMTMMFATAGVFAAPEGNDAEKSDYWKVEVAKEADSPAVIVWSTEDTDYEHKADAVFNIYRLKENGEKELIAENVMSKSAAAKVEVGGGEDEPLVYVYNDKEDAKDKAGKEIPLGYSYTADDLDLDADSDVIVEKVDEDKNDEGKSDETKPDGKPEGTKEENGSDDADSSKLKSGGKTLNTSEVANYNLSDGTSNGDTYNTAIITWKMDKDLPNGAKADINGYKVTPKSEGGRKYSYRVTGLNPMKSYTVAVKIIDINGKVISNTLNIKVSEYCTLSAGKVKDSTPNTAVVSWIMNKGLSDGAKVDINGYRVTPTYEGSGRFSYTVTGLNPMKSYTVAVKMVDKSGNVVSNTINIKIGTYCTLSSGKVTDTTPNTAVLSWIMPKGLKDGQKIDINGYKVTPTYEGSGRFSYRVTGLNPQRSYTVPVKMVDKNGQQISNTINIKIDPYCTLSSGKVTDTTPNTAVLSWIMPKGLKDGQKIDINGYKIEPTYEGSGRFTYKVTGLNPLNSYTVPVKMVDKNGQAISNTINIKISPYNVLSGGKATDLTQNTAVLSWIMTKGLKDGQKVVINGYKVDPTYNGSGRFSFKVTGFDPAKVYNVPIKVVDKNGQQISNTIYITVDYYGSQIKTMQVQFTFSENRELHSYTGGTVWTKFYAGETYTCTGFDNGRYQFTRDGRMYYVNRLSTTNQKIVSSDFDRTYPASTATNFVNGLGLSSSTNYLIWVNTYTQKMYIFYGSKGNWRLVQGPWVVSTGKPTTMTSTGLAEIRQKDYYDRNLYYWNVVSYFSIHGKVSEWVLGYPRSDGCVRNTDDHASYVYYNCPIGTAVYVY